MVIEPISKNHNRRIFDCGEAEVTRFLREQSLQDSEKGLSRTMVLVDETEDSSRIVGYHTLVFVQIAQQEIPDEKPRIKRPILVILLGQLGVDVEFQGRGPGEQLLMDAQARVEEVSRRTGIRAMILDARNEKLARWYESYDFKRFPGQLRMGKGIRAIRAMKLQGSGR